MEAKYKRVLLKLSGEALSGGAGRGLDFDIIGQVCDVIKKCNEAGIEIGIVIGGGNFWRGVKDGGSRMERTRADHMGMMATVLNCLAVADVLEQKGVPVRVQTASEMKEIAEALGKIALTQGIRRGQILVRDVGSTHVNIIAERG